MWKGHTVSHHGTYAPDDHYTQDDTNKKEVLTFSWYEGPLIIMLSTFIFYFFDISARTFLGLNLDVLGDVVGAAIAFSLYYTAYEWLHAIMHVPGKWRWIRNTGIMIWLNRRHYQHHVDPRTNFNVILPLADFILGTNCPLPKKQWKIADALDNKN